MKMLRIILLFIVPAVSFAAGPTAGMKHIKINLADNDALQKGARNYVNYCMGCHSLKFSSYLRVGKDLRLTEDQVIRNLIVSYDKEKKISDYMTVSMTKAQGKALFSKVPPDLSTISRAKGGPSWLYSYMMNFYLDPNRPYGVNNLTFPNVGMPHVTIGLQGEQKAIFKKGKDGKKHFEKFELVKKGSMSPERYREFVKNLVTFLAYVGEPAKLERQRLGVWVLLFLLLFTIIARMLYKEYWKDVH